MTSVEHEDAIRLDRHAAPPRTRRGMRLDPIGALIDVNRRIWKRLPPAATANAHVQAYGAWLHRLVRARATRRQHFGTFFMRNRPTLTLIRRLTERIDLGAKLKMAFLGCSNGAEVYSTLWTIRSGRPDLEIIAHAVDLSPELVAMAERGVYSFAAKGIVESPIFARISDTEMGELFDVDLERGDASIKPWIKRGIAWHVGDAASPDIADALGPQDLVVANNFLCHLPPRAAERCLRHIARLVAPGGYLFVSGVDLDVRTRVASELGWRPLPELAEAIHDGDPAVRNDWPCHYWGLEPLDTRRPDWLLRYATVFQMPACPPATHTRVSFLGNFGHGNLGNEITLRAILHHLRRHVPHATVNCICTGPESTAAVHAIPTVPIHEHMGRPGLLGTSAFGRTLRRVLIGIPREGRRLIKASRVLRGRDMLIVPGTQFLSDNLTSPWDWPYMAFKWSLIAKLRGSKVLFVSVGVGPLRHPLSRWFARAALSLAAFRSYRDRDSREYARGLGVDVTHDPIYPDLAFSSAPETACPHRRNGKPVIALGVKDYHGQYGTSLRATPAATYRQYIDRTATLLAALFAREYTVRLVIGDMAYDPPVLVDLRQRLGERGVPHHDHQLISEPITSVNELVEQLAQSDVVVSPRFHNVILGLVLSRPVIALAYHEKFFALMDSVGLARYTLPIDDWDAAAVLERLEELEEHYEDVQRHIVQGLGRQSDALEEQYRVIFDAGC